MHFSERIPLECHVTVSMFLPLILRKLIKQVGGGTSVICFFNGKGIYYSIGDLKMSLWGKFWTV